MVVHTAKGVACSDDSNWLRWVVVGELRGEVEELDLVLSVGDGNGRRRLLWRRELRRVHGVVLRHGRTM